MITVEDVRAAAARIAGSIRHTPTIRADQTRTSPVPLDVELWLKLECLQVSGSFKARGASNLLLSLQNDTLRRGIVTASGGNHGVAVARAAHLAGVPATIFLPEGASPAKKKKIIDWGGEVRVVGRFWDESNAIAQAFSRDTDRAYFHPFADPAIIAGQGTIALELLDRLPDANLFLVAIGGGGLIAGMSTVLREMRPDARIVGIEPTGSPTLHASLAQDRVVTLEAVTTHIPTMACARTHPDIFAIARRNVDSVVLLEDAEMMDAARWLWFEFGIAADASGAAAVAALRSGRVDVRPGDRICALVCGAGTDGFSV
jgi:threonine dehydratase